MMKRLSGVQSGSPPGISRTSPSWLVESGQRSKRIGVPCSPTNTHLSSGDHFTVRSKVAPIPALLVIVVTRVGWPPSFDFGFWILDFGAIDVGVPKSKIENP